MREVKEMEFNIPTIVIGLGGTGLKTVVYLKRKVKSIVDGGLIKFLCIDSDKNEVLVNELEADEYINIGVPGVSYIINNLRSETAEYIRPWFPSNLNFKVVSGDEGAKQFRPMGRLYLFRNIDKVFSSIDMVTKQLRARFADVKVASKTINVYIVSSTCGGTGSGMILDVAYIVRKVIEEDNATSSIIKGILFLPTAFHPFPISDEAEKKHLFANGYATIKEIDHFMSPNKETEYKVEYSQTRSIRSKNRPFDVCYLIDDENEEFPVGSLDDTIEAVSESLVILLTSGVGTSVKSAEDNLFTVLSGTQKMQPYSNKNYLYSSFGTSSVIYPYEMVKKYVAGRLVKHVYDILNRDIKFNMTLDMIKFLKMDELESDDLINSLYSYRKISSSEISEKIFQAENKDLQITIKEKIIVESHSIIEELKNKIEQNFNDFVENKFQEFKKLVQDYISSPQMGFFVVYKLLTDPENGLPAYIQKVKEVLSKEIEDHNWKINKLNEDVNFISETIIQKSNKLIARIFNTKDKKLIDNFSKSISNLYDNLLFKLLKEYSVRFYNKFSMLVQKYVSEELEPTYSLWQRFINDYINEYIKISFSSKSSSWGTRINFYVANKEIIDKDIEMIIENDNNKIIANIYKLFDNFMNFRLEKFKEYEQRLLEFVDQYYKEYLYMDIEDQIVTMFGNEENVINRLLRASSILYRYRSQLFNEDYLKYYKVLGVKNINDTRFFSVAKMQNIEVIENYNPFRISMLQVKHGLPLYSFVLIDIMEKSYMELISSDPGLHIDPNFQKFDNLSLDYEFSQQDYEKYLLIYLALLFDLLRKDGINYSINLRGVKIEFSSDKNDTVDMIFNKLREKEFYQNFKDMVEEYLRSIDGEAIKLTVKEYLQKISNRIYYLNNKRSLTKEENMEKENLEKEQKVLKTFIDSGI